MKQISKAGAKSITLEVREYLAEHPEIESKLKLPEYLFNKIKDSRAQCALCEVYEDCAKCILETRGGHGCDEESAYSSWLSSAYGEDGNMIRAAAAREIVEIVKTMETED